MKTKELIRLLNKHDPEGELEVNVGGADIYTVDRLPGYYDGCYEVLKRDPDCKYFNVVGAEVRSGGSKIKLHTLSIADAIGDVRDLPVTYDGDYARKHSESAVEHYRKYWDDIDLKCDRNHFVQYVAKRFTDNECVMENAKEDALAFYDANLSPTDKLYHPCDKQRHSLHSLREYSWDKKLKFEVSLDRLLITRDS